MAPVRLLLCLLNVCFLTVLAGASESIGPLLQNGDFENGTWGWNPVWAREPGAAKAVLDTTKPHGGTQSLRIDHIGPKDWSLARSVNLKVQPGEIYELSAWCRVQGPGWHGLLQSHPPGAR